ncbi:MAG: hypothetical protein AAFQ63_11300 [Cyanobacteria bacterium J06621_11]
MVLLIGFTDWKDAERSGKRYTLQRTDFRGVRGLTQSQIEAAADGVESSLFDGALRQELRLVEPNTETESASCRMQPRKLEWWRQWFGK